MEISGLSSSLSARSKGVRGTHVTPSFSVWVTGKMVKPTSEREEKRKKQLSRVGFSGADDIFQFAVASF